MKFRVEHLGQIASAELDIRPLTLLVGRNNTNKTWAAYALYGLLQQAAWGDDSYQLHPDEPGVAQRTEHAAIGRTIAPWVEKIMAETFDAAGQGTQTGLPSLVVSRGEVLPLDTQRLTFHLGPDELVGFLAVPRERTAKSSARLEVNIAEETAPRAQLQLRIRVRKGVVDLVVRSHDLAYTKALFFRSQAELTEVLERALSDLARYSFRRVFALPAERKALTSIYNHLRDSIEQALPRPVADFVTFLRHTHAHASERNSQQGRGARNFLRDILEGSVGYAQAGPGWQAVYEPKQASFTLPIQAASSLVRAMAGLDLILEENLGRGDVLLIDEVEMNAHPATQLALVELLCTLVHEGVYVIMTSHSPYVVDHLNNLMLASTLPAETQERFRERFSLGTTDAFLPPDKVSAYLFERGGHVQDIMDREAGRISWTTFAEVSDQLSNLYADLDMAAAGSNAADG